MTEIALTALETVADIVMGQSPPGNTTNSEGSGTPLLNGPTEFRQVSPLPVQWTSRPARLAAVGDVLFCVRGSTTGRMNIADQPYAIGRGLAAIRGKRDADTEFVRYALTLTLPQLLAKATGSTFPNLSREDIAQHLIPMPPENVRAAAAEVLGALDEKISTNRILAATADAWIRARLTALTAEAEESIRLGAVVAHRRELAFPNALDPTTPYLGLEHLPRRSAWVEASGVAGSVISTKSRFKHGDILFGKLRPYFHKVVLAPFDGVCSTDVLTLHTKDPQLSGFALASVMSDFVVERATASSEGTRMPRTSWKDLSAIEVAWPGLAEARRFSTDVSTLTSSVESLLRENQTIAATRDALLPHLMSGKLRIKDVEKVLEGAGA